MGNVLQRAHIGLRARGAAADQQNRRPGERGVGDRRDRVGDARTGRHHRDTKFACQLGVGVRHVDRRGLVANVDDADAKLRGMVPDRLDVPALQAENAVDPARFQETRDPSRAGITIGIEIFGACRHLVPPDRLRSLCRWAPQPKIIAFSLRCKFFPVAVRGISSSRMNEKERGRL